MTIDNQSIENGFTMNLVMHKQSKRGRTVLRSGARPDVGKSVPAGRIPRISRMMALAIHFQKLLVDGVVQDYADIARLTGVTRARVTQIMNLTLLAPEIQENLLFLPRTEHGADSLTEKVLRDVGRDIIWTRQRQSWKMFSG